MKRNLVWSIGLIVAAVILAIMVMGNLQTPVRAPLTIAFFLVGPGMAFVLWLRIADWITELTLAVALSIALTTLISEAMLFAGAWSSSGAALGLLAWTVVGALVPLVRALATRFARGTKPNAHGKQMPHGNLQRRHS